MSKVKLLVIGNSDQDIMIGVERFYNYEGNGSDTAINNYMVSCQRLSRPVVPADLRAVILTTGRIIDVEALYWMEKEGCLESIKRTFFNSVAIYKESL